MVRSAVGSCYTTGGRPKLGFGTFSAELSRTVLEYSRSELSLLL